MKTISTLFFLLLIFSCFYAAKAQQSNTLPDTTRFGKNEQAGKYINTRGFVMYYETYGSGEALLFIHGNGGIDKQFLQPDSLFLKKI